MRSRTLALAVSATVAGGLLGAAPAQAAPPTNVIGLANLALNQMLTLDPTGALVTMDGSDSLPQIFDLVYQDTIPNEPDMSSPYLLRVHDTDLCLRDGGPDHTIVAVACETQPAAGSAQLWQNHRVADRQVGNRSYYLRFNQATDRVMTAEPTAAEVDQVRVLSRPAEPISRSGAADVQLWTMLAA